MSKCQSLFILCFKILIVTRGPKYLPLVEVPVFSISKITGSQNKKKHQHTWNPGILQLFLNKVYEFPKYLPQIHSLRVLCFILKPCKFCVTFYDVDIFA